MWFNVGQCLKKKGGGMVENGFFADLLGALLMMVYILSQRFLFEIVLFQPLENSLYTERKLSCLASVVV